MNNKYQLIHQALFQNIPPYQTKRLGCGNVWDEKICSNNLLDLRVTMTSFL